MKPRESAPVLTSRALHEWFAWVALESGVPRISWATTDASGDLRVSRPAERTDMPIMYGNHCFRFGPGMSTPFAYPTSPSSWVIARSHSLTTLRTPDDFEVRGLVQRGAGPGELGLVGLDRTQRRIEFLLNGPPELLLSTSTPVTCLEVSNSGREFGFMTSAGVVGVYSCQASAVTMRMAAGVAS